MTQKSRYFLIASAAMLIVGVGGGLMAYLAYQRASGVPAGLPAELRYVPANASLVAYVNVHGLVNSALHREMMPIIETGSRRGRQMMDDFAGIDLEKQVDHVVTYVEAPNPTDPSADQTARPGPPPAVMLVQGTFDQARIEQFVRDKDGIIETHNGRHIALHKQDPDGMALGFVRSDLLAVGRASLVRRALDAPTQDQSPAINAELMSLIRDASGSTAWVVGNFDAVSRSMRLPGSVRDRVPPVRLISAQAHVNGGAKATITAQTADDAAAEQLREVVRGFIALARLQSGSQPQFENTLKSIELSGSEKTVRLSFAISPETVRAFSSSLRNDRGRGGRGGRGGNRNPDVR